MSTWRALALATLLVTALAPAASLPAEAPPSAAIAAPPTTTAADPPASSATLVPAGLGPAAGCDARSMLPDRGLGAVCVAPDLESDQAYLVETARPGSTMLHQGPALAITRLHPIFVRRLAEAIREARGAGLRSAGIFSAYRPPAFGVGGFSDKFNSLHSYGLAVDMLGIGGPGSSEAKLWHEIAARHGIVCPYGAGNRREWNHCQPTRVKIILVGNPLRGTISPRGPVDLKAMFAVGDTLVSEVDVGTGPREPLPAGAQAGASRAQAQADPSHEPHRRVKSVAGSVANPSLHEAQGEPKRRIIAENASALAKRIEAENARIDRLLKGICRGC